MRSVTLASRGSMLARWQSDWVAERLREAHPGLGVDIRLVRTSGDRFQEASLQALGGKGAFTKEIQDAMLAGDADIAVHSLKDLPTQPVPGLSLLAYPARFDTRDGWIGRDGLDYRDLRAGMTVATGSLRRKAQLLARHPGVRVEEIRGNVDTRLKKFAAGTMEGMFLAVAGLKRLGWEDRLTRPLEPDECLPAPGQGALAVEARDEPALRQLLAPLNDAACLYAVTAERAFLAELEAGCQVPVGALARVEGERVVLRGLVVDLDGSRTVTGEHSGACGDAAEVGTTLARRLVEQGAGDILSDVRRTLGDAP